MLGALWQTAVDFLFPPRCPICRAYVEAVGGWCESCLAKTARPHRLPLTPAMLGAISEAWAVSRYHGGTRDLVRALKYRGQKSVLPYIVTLLQAAVGGNVAEECVAKDSAASAQAGVGPRARLAAILAAVDLAIPVPLHAKKEKERGFNQTELIFRDFLAGENIALVRVLERIRPTQPMYQLTAAERAANLKGAFALMKDADVRGKNILLLDDILTTGSTLYECARILKKAGAAKIYVLVLASDHS